MKEVATGRENYYTGAVAEGEPPGRWWGAGAEQLGLTGLVDAQDMRGGVRAVPRPARTRGSTTRPGGTRCPPSDTPDAGTCPRTSCTPRRLNASRTPRLNAALNCGSRPGKAARHNVAFFDVTFSVQKSVTLLHTAFEAQEVAARTAGDEETAAGVGGVPAGGRGRDLGGQQRRAGLPGRARRLLPGRAPRRRRRAAGSTPTTGSSRRSSSTTPATTTRSCTSTTAMLNRVQGPDGVWRTLDGRSLFRWRPAAGGGRRAHHRGAAHPRARGAGRDPPGRQGPRDRRRRRRRRWT